MKSANSKNVNSVTLNVMVVPKMKKIVTNVPLTESMPQPVIVLIGLVSTIVLIVLIILTLVQNVIVNAILVIMLMINVKLVLVSESTHNKVVSVQLVSLIKDLFLLVMIGVPINKELMMKLVNFVPSSVKPVLVPLIPVTLAQITLTETI
jgi:hypothetical protein